MWVRAKDKLAKSKRDEGYMTDDVRNLEKAPTQWDNFAFPLIPFLNLASTASSSAESSMSLESTSPRIGSNSWFTISSQGHSDLAARKEEMGGTAPLADQIMKFKQVSIVEQTLG